MPACPVCRDEFEDSVARCPVDDVVLVATDALPPVPAGEAQLGSFHPLAAAPLRRSLEQRGVPVRVVDVDDAHQQLWVPAPVRDQLRAELTMSWTSMLRMVDPEQLTTLAEAAGGDQPGWYDAPRSSWIDRDGRLRVEGTPDEEAVADASRTLGPALALAGIVMLLLAWVTDGSDLLVVGGIGSIVLGVLLPR